MNTEGDEMRWDPSKAAKGGAVTYVKLPARGKPEILCRYCACEIEAYEREKQTIVVCGLYAYRWRHVDTGLRECPPAPPTTAAPGDDWLAQKRLNHGAYVRRILRGDS